MIQGIHHVSMKCSNAEEYAAVRAFYTELLRIPVLTEWEMGILLDTGAGIVEIFQDETAEKLGQGVIRHFAFAVEDVEACVAAGAGWWLSDFSRAKNCCHWWKSSIFCKDCFLQGCTGGRN